MLVEVKKFGKEEKVAVTSLDVAATFGKEHRRVLQDIRGNHRSLSETRRSNRTPRKAQAYHPLASYSQPNVLSHPGSVPHILSVRVLMLRASCVRLSA